MSWNYRLVDHGTHLSLREAYYQGDHLWGYSADPRKIVGESIDDIEEDLELMLKDLRRFPPIPESELPGE